MCDFGESSQLHSWLFGGSPKVLRRCRARANKIAREILAQPPDDNGEKSFKPTSGSTILSVVEFFACGYYTKYKKEHPDHNDEMMDVDYDDSNNSDNGGPWENPNGNPFLTPDEEQLLVSFYVSKLPSLIGPMAQVPRLRREFKVTATAALFVRRFFMSNSVMFHDPKAVMVAAAFLAAKVEDAMTDIRYLEDGTNLMNAPVSSSEILPAELALIQGINFDLLCFHSYKAVVALTEDLRTFLKSEKGKCLVLNSADRIISSQDLKPMYDTARALLDDVIVSDIPLLYSPGQIGLAALMVANDNNTQISPEIPQIDLMGYIRERFKDNKDISFDENNIEYTVQKLCNMLRELKDGHYGCGNHKVDLSQLKTINKKLKKCKVWGIKEKKSKKRDKASSDVGSTTSNDNSKRSRT